MQVRSLGQEDRREKEMVTPLQYSCLGNPMDRKVWQATAHGVARVRHDLATNPPPPSVKTLLFFPFGIGLWKRYQLSLKNYILNNLQCTQNCSQVYIFPALVQFSCSVMSNSLGPQESQHARTPCPSPTPRVHPNPCPLSRWCHTTISSSVIPFFSCPQSFPASGSFQMSQLFASGSQSIGVWASASVLPVNTQHWSPSGWTGRISLQSKGLSRVFSNTTVQKHQFIYTM